MDVSVTHFTLPCLINCVTDSSRAIFCCFFFGTPSIHDWILKEGRVLTMAQSFFITAQILLESPVPSGPCPLKLGPTPGEASKLCGPQQSLLPESGLRSRGYRKAQKIWGSPGFIQIFAKIKPQRATQSRSTLQKRSRLSILQTFQLSSAINLWLLKHPRAFCCRIS